MGPWQLAHQQRELLLEWPAGRPFEQLRSPAVQWQKYSVHHFVRWMARSNQGRQLRSAGGQFLRSVSDWSVPEPGPEYAAQRLWQFHPLQSEGPAVPEPD